MDKIFTEYLRTKRYTPEIDAYFQLKTGFLNDHYADVINRQRIWHIKNNVYDLVYCPGCKTNLAKWTDKKSKYTTCSKECSMKLVMQTTINRHGEYNADRIEELRHKKITTSIERYGVEDWMLVEENKIRVKDTNFERYGVDSYSQTEESKLAIKATCMERYGVENYAQSEEYKIKTAETCIERFGTVRYSQTDEFKNNATKRFISKLQTLVGNVLTIHIFDDKFVTFHCNDCEQESTMIRYTLRDRIRSKIHPCPVCRPQNISTGEEELSSFVKSIYGGEVIDNTRTVINPYELDIFLPELMVALEFNGSYYHADPRLFPNLKYVYRRPVSIVRKRDADKIRLCKSKGITLIVVWEYDWINDQDKIKNSIINMINIRKAM